MAKFIPRDHKGRVIPFPQGGIITPSNDSPVEIDLGDGIDRPLRYSLGKLKLMRDLGILSRRDDADIPALIWVGLHDEQNNPPDVTVEQLAALGTPWLGYLSAAFVAAWSQSQPPAPADTPEKKD